MDSDLWRWQKRGGCSGLVVLIALLGCATGSARLPAPAADRPLGVAPGASVSKDLARTVSQPDRQPRPPMLRLLESTRFTINVLDADLSGLLLGLGRESPLNIVVEPGVTGTVTADLKDASLLSILDEIVVPRGYRYAIQGRVLRIHRSDRETRAYQLDYPNYSRKGSSELQLAGFIAAAPSITEDDGGGGGAEDTSISTVETTQQMDFWTEVDAGVRTIVYGSPEATSDPAAEGEGSQDASGVSGPPRRVVTSRQAGVISVTADRATLDDVDVFLGEVDRSLDKQVLIDAQILEVSIDDDLAFGFDIEGSPDLTDLTGVFARSIIPGLREASLVQKLAPVLTEGSFSFGIANDDFGIILHALAQQKDIRVISTPRITALNNHKALIKVVRNEVFFVAEVETVVNQNTVLQTTEFTPKVVPVGVTLDVTPHVSDEAEITLHVRPSVSEIVSVVLQPQSDPNLPQQGSLPIVDLRETDTVLRVSDGATIVIGGLVQSREFESESRVPLIGDIPYLGNLFKRVSTEERRTELLILLTPTILDPPRVVRIADDLTREVRSVDDLRKVRSLPWPWWRHPIGESYGAWQ